MKIPKIRLIATDLDGTLLRDDKTIDEKTKERLIQAQKQGIIIVIATGRHKSEIDFVTKPLQLSNMEITMLRESTVKSFIATKTRNIS